MKKEKQNKFFKRKISTIGGVPLIILIGLVVMVVTGGVAYSMLYQNSTISKDKDGVSETKNSISTAEGEIVDKTSFKNSFVYIEKRNQKEYVVLERSGQRFVLDEGYPDQKSIEEKELTIEQLKNFSNLKFSPEGNYLMYSETGWESNLRNHVYDIRDQRHALQFRGGEEAFAFTPDEEYFYICSNARMGAELGAEVYETSEFEKVYDLLEERRQELFMKVGDKNLVPSVLSCSYSKEDDSINFVLQVPKDESTRMKQKYKYFPADDRVEMIQL